MGGQGFFHSLLKHVLIECHLLDESRLTWQRQSSRTMAPLFFMNNHRINPLKTTPAIYRNAIGSPRCQHAKAGAASYLSPAILSKPREPCRLTQRASQVVVPPGAASQAMGRLKARFSPSLPRHTPTWMPVQSPLKGDPSTKVTLPSTNLTRWWKSILLFLLWFPSGELVLNTTQTPR